VFVFSFLGFGVLVWGFGFWVCCLGFGVWGLGVWGLGFRVDKALGLRVYAAVERRRFELVIAGPSSPAPACPIKQLLVNYHDSFSITMTRIQLL